MSRNRVSPDLPIDYSEWDKMPDGESYGVVLAAKVLVNLLRQEEGARRMIVDVLPDSSISHETKVSISLMYGQRISARREAEDAFIEECERVYREENS